MTPRLCTATDYRAASTRSPPERPTPRWVGCRLDAADDPDAAAEALRRRQPSGRLVTAAEVAHAVVSLASPAAG